jgi:hypothetical protein
VRTSGVSVSKHWPVQPSPPALPAKHSLSYPGFYGIVAELAFASALYTDLSALLCLHRSLWYAHDVTYMANVVHKHQVYKS